MRIVREDNFRGFAAKALVTAANNYACYFVGSFNPNIVLPRKGS